MQLKNGKNKPYETEVASDIGIMRICHGFDALFYIPFGNHSEPLSDVTGIGPEFNWHKTLALPELRLLFKKMNGSCNILLCLSHQNYVHFLYIKETYSSRFYKQL